MSLTTITHSQVRDTSSVLVVTQDKLRYVEDLQRIKRTFVQRFVTTDPVFTDKNKIEMRKVN